MEIANRPDKMITASNTKFKWLKRIWMNWVEFDTSGILFRHTQPNTNGKYNQLAPDNLPALLRVSIYIKR